MAKLVTKVVSISMFSRNFATMRSIMQHSKSYVYNLVPFSVWLFVPRNIRLVRRKTMSAAPPPPPVSSIEDAKREKKSRARQKTLKINAAISENDLSIKTSHMCKWLEKGHPVSILISKIENKPQDGEKIFGQMVDASKDLAVVKNAKKTATSMNFVLQPNAKPSEAELSNDDVKQTQTSSAPVQPFKIDELRKLRSEVNSAEVDKS